MKISVSVPEEDLAALDEAVRELGLPSRSAAVQKAIRLLAARDLGAAYQAAFDEWSGSADAADWDAVSADGLSGA